MSDALAAHFWEGCAAGELRYQRCASCGGAQFPPRPFCLACNAGEPAWAVARGEGRIAALTLVIRAPDELFRALVPYAIALVDLHEGFRMMAHAAGGLALGDAVRVTFRVVGGRSLPEFFPE